MYATILAREVEKKERIRERRELRYHKSVKRRIAFFVFLPFLLVSCGKDNSLKCPLENNGDISALSAPTEYEDVCAKTSAERLIERMDNGESVSFLFTSTSCSHCAEWKSTFVSFLHDNPYEVNLFENGLITYTEYRTVLNLFKEYFNVTADDWGATPMLYVGKKGQLNFLGAANLSYQGLANGFKSVGASSAITSFRDYSAYAAYLSKNPTALTFLKDSSSGSAALSYYASTLYPSAQFSSKPLAVLNYSEMDSANQTLALQGFALSAYAPILKDSARAYDVSKESEAAEATSLIHSYFA